MSPDDACRVTPERLIMLSDHTTPLPDAPLPRGFQITPLTGPQGVTSWVDIWREAHPGLAVDSQRFHRAFGEDADLIGRRVTLLLAPNGLAVGTGAAWFGELSPGSGRIGRLHWLAIRPSAQGRGLGAALLAFLVRRLRDTHERSYLVTQSDRQAAIRLYHRFGYDFA